jgi:hypothetical protein
VLIFIIISDFQCLTIYIIIGERSYSFLQRSDDKKKYSSQSTFNLNDEFKRIVSNTFKNQFHLQGISANGSSANVFAIVDSTRGDTGCCLIAAGSYLCSAGFVLCHLATSEFQLNSPLSLIREPLDDDELFVKKQSLHYHIIFRVPLLEQIWKHMKIFVYVSFTRNFYYIELKLDQS